MEVVRRSVATPEVVIFDEQSPSENLNPEELRRSTDCNNSDEKTAIVAATKAIDFAARSPAFVQARSKQLMAYLRYFDRRLRRRHCQFVSMVEISVKEVPPVGSDEQA